LVTYVCIIATLRSNTDYLQAIVVTERDVVAAREPEFDDHEDIDRVVDEEKDIELDVSFSFRGASACIQFGHFSS
jgi:hypothetical protein